MLIPIDLLGIQICYLLTTSMKYSIDDLLVDIHQFRNVSKRLHNYGKSPAFMGNLSLSTAMFNSFIPT